ncbi:MAG TPA: glycosyltransferase family 39 protein [Patescibacteria group bacterium]|nr:glycosyltransferase family 39 protein [Patescibacteria group bacterium]
MKKTYLFLILIFALGLFLRFYKLGEVPVGLHTDEAYFGYNAYSILKTGREITGNFLPLNLKSFLFSPAGYSYASIPFIVIFGLSAFSTRFASALFGSLTIIVAFFLIRQLFKVFKNKEQIALVAAFFLAISPWHINLSRVSTESVLVVFFVSLGVLFYLFWEERNRYYFLALSLLAFAVNILIYQAARSFLPLFLPLLFLVFTKRIFVKRNIFPIAGFILLIIIPVLLILKSPDLSTRIRTLSIFQNPQTQLVLNEQLREDGVMGLNSFEARLFNNKLVDYSLTFSSNYFKHFSYDFLFTDNGLPERYRVPGMGILYLFELPLIVLGIWYLFRRNQKLGLFIVGWILLAPVGSALTFDDVPNLQRTLIVFPALSVLTALGFINLLSILKVNIKKVLILRAITIGIVLIIVCSFFYYLQAYYVHQIVHRPWYRQEGYQKLVGEINKYARNYPKVIITNAQVNPTIFLLFYNQYDPANIQKVIQSSPGVDYGNTSFAKYQITGEECPVREEILTDKKTGLSSAFITGEKRVLYVDDGVCKLPNGKVRILSQIRRSDNTLVFQLVTLK